MAHPDHIRYPGPEARQRFGETLSAWCQRAGWGHDLCHRWGKAAGFPTVADSTFNRLQNARIEQPFPVTFLQFGILNDRLSRRDYGLPEDHPLIVRLNRQEALASDDGLLWRATEFFSHFVGELEAPTWARLPELPSLEQAVRVSSDCAERFRAIAAARGLLPAAAWQSFALVAAGTLSPDELNTMRDVLAGWQTWTPEQLRAFLRADRQRVA